jgi:hypothetical protein
LRCTISLRVKDKGQRSEYSEYKVKYSYMDARRFANLRGGIIIKGPVKVFDTTPALIGGLFADKHGRLLEYSRIAFKLFFQREFEADDPEAVASLIADVGCRRPNTALTSSARAPRTTGARRKRPPSIVSSACRCSSFGASSSGATTAWSSSSGG